MQDPITIADKDQQRQILKRFLQITLGRLARIREDLSDKQQLFLDALPILLHTNHPEFPCFTSDYTPCGICRYFPSGAEIRKLQQLVPGFTAGQINQNEENILGVYLSGDCGSIIESHQQNMEVWVCYRQDLGENQIALLEKKCQLIEQWASSLDLNVLFRVVDANFGDGEQKHTHSRQQNFLELDRLYRSGVLIAGRMPLWWLIPPQYEKNYHAYTAQLIREKAINLDDIIDFGRIPDIPAHELIDISFQQLSRCQDAPYDICLKQLLTEIYISEYPQTDILSKQFKQAVYNNQLDLDALDPYVMVYRRIESYLTERGELRRLELARRCFYYQIGKPISQYTQKPTWQQKVLERLINEWGWNKEKLRELDNKAHWHLRHIQQEHLQLTHELNLGYRFAAEFTRHHRQKAHAALPDITRLGKRLYAAFERKSGKADLFNLNIVGRLKEDNLFFLQMKHRLRTVWAVYAEPVSHRDIPNTLPLRRSESLLELIAWCHLNNLITDETKLDILDGDHQFTVEELKNSLIALREALPPHRNILKINDEAFDSQAYPLTIQMFFNLGSDPDNELKARHKNLTGLISQAEPAHIAYPISNIEVMTLNSWGEINCKRYEGPSALLACIGDYIQMLALAQHSARLPQLFLQGNSFDRQETTILRMEELFHDLQACFFQGNAPVNSRYILQMKQLYYVIQNDNGQTLVQQAKTLPHLFKLLAQPQTSFSPIVFDRQALNDTVLPAIAAKIQADGCHIFIQHEDDGVRFYLVDERGSLYHHTVPGITDQDLLMLEQFLYNTYHRQTVWSPPHPLRQGHIHVHQITQAEDKHLQILPSDGAHTNTTSCQPAKIQVLAEPGKNNGCYYKLLIDQQYFSESLLGDALYRTAASFIKQSYPQPSCYVVDMDLSALSGSGALEQPQTLEYLRRKYEIERQINNFL